MASKKTASKTLPHSQPRLKIQLVYAGLRQSTKDKLMQTFYKILPDGTLEDSYRAYSKIKGLGRPGAIYDVECDASDESTIYTSSLSYFDQWDDDAQVVKWQAEHDAARAADRARRRHNREGKRNLVEERLKPIRDVYWKCNGLERAALLAQVVGYITGRLPER